MNTRLMKIASRIRSSNDGHTKFATIDDPLNKLVINDNHNLLGQCIVGTNKTRGKPSGGGAAWVRNGTIWFSFMNAFFQTIHERDFSFMNENCHSYQKQFINEIFHSWTRFSIHERELFGWMKISFMNCLFKCLI